MGDGCQAIAIDDLPAEVLSHILEGTDERGRALLDVGWRFAAASVCRRWLAIVRHPTPGRSRALAASTRTPRRSLRAVLEKEDAFTATYCLHQTESPLTVSSDTSCAAASDVGVDRKALERAAVRGSLVSASYLVDAVRRRTLTLPANTTGFDLVPWAGVGIPPGDAALCRLLALDDAAPRPEALRAINATLDSLCHYAEDRSTCALLNRLVRNGRVALIDTLLDRTPTAFSPWWHVRLACKYDNAPSLMCLLAHALDASDQCGREWIAVAWRKVALRDAVDVLKSIIDQDAGDSNGIIAYPQWSTVPMQKRQSMLRASCTESWVANVSWQRKAARNGSWRVLEACASRGLDIALDVVMREAALHAWSHTVAWAIDRAKSVPPTASSQTDVGTNAVVALCEDALRAVMHCGNGWPRNTSSTAQYKTVSMLCTQLEQQTDRDRWAAMAVSLWRTSGAMPDADPGESMPWGRPFVFARWHALLSLTCDETRSIIKRAITVNDYGLLDVLVASFTSQSLPVSLQRPPPSSPRLTAASPATIATPLPTPTTTSATRDMANAERGGTTAADGAFDLWQMAVDRYTHVSRTIERRRHHYVDIGQGMDAVLLSWNMGDATEMLMFLASVAYQPKARPTTNTRGSNDHAAVSAPAALWCAGGPAGPKHRDHDDHGDRHSDRRDRDARALCRTQPNPDASVDANTNDSDNDHMIDDAVIGVDDRGGAVVDDCEHDGNGAIPGLRATIGQWRRVCHVNPIASNAVGWAPASNIAYHLAQWLDDRGLLLCGSNL